MQLSIIKSELEVSCIKETSILWSGFEVHYQQCSVAQRQQIIKTHGPLNVGKSFEAFQLKTREFVAADKHPFQIADTFGWFLATQ